jgi:hypothetical protein
MLHAVTPPVTPSLKSTLFQGVPPRINESIKSQKTLISEQFATN